MAVYELPNEIIIEISRNLENEQDIAFLARVSWRFYHLFNEYLYCYNIRYRKAGALSWAARNCRESTARKLLHLGANVNTKMRTARFSRGRYISGLTPLHWAALKGHLPMVKLLLEVGADPEARVDEGFISLYFALINRHEKVARTISRRMGNLQDCLVDSTRRLTPLHLSCRLGLHGYARYFLENGADVDAKDANAMTPLHHALGQNLPLMEPGRCPTEPRSKPRDDSEQVLETVKLLLEFKADQTCERPPRYMWEKPTTARKCGANHPYEPVRALFSDYATASCQNACQLLRIGRTWMTSSELSGTDCIGADVTNHFDDKPFADDHSGVHIVEGDMGHREKVNISSFPPLDCPNDLPDSGFKPNLLGGIWSLSNTRNLLAGFSSPGRVQNPPIAERQVHVDPYPYLSNHVPNDLGETEAGKLWAGLEKPKSQRIAGFDIRDPSEIQKDASSGIKGKKMGGKKQWQPLNL